MALYSYGPHGIQRAELREVNAALRQSQQHNHELRLECDRLVAESERLGADVVAAKHDAARHARRCAELEGSKFGEQQLAAERERWEVLEREMLGRVAAERQRAVDVETALADSKRACAAAEQNMKRVMEQLEQSLSHRKSLEEQASRLVAEVGRLEAEVLDEHEKQAP